MRLGDRLIVRFAGHETIWRLRRRLRNLGFRVSRRLFSLRYEVREGSTRARALPQLLRHALLPVLLAIGLVVLIAVLDDPARRVISDWGWHGVRPGTYDVLLETVAGATGVFLALYFTAVSTVAASVYVNVPHDVRELIVKDRLGNLYVAGVAFTIALSVLLLIVHALSDQTLVLGPPVVGVFAAFSIFAFIQLGQRAFYLADPTRLGSTLIYEFQTWVKHAVAGGWKWQDANFQRHYHVRARQSVKSLKSLLAIARAQPHLRGSSVRQITRTSTALLAYYLPETERIPTTSRWFSQRYEHKQWYLTDSTELDSATQTETALTPKAIPDRAWVESILMPELIAVLDADLAEGNFDDAYGLIADLEAVWVQFGARWDVREPNRWLSEIEARVLARTASEDATALPPKAGARPAMWDAIAMLPIACELGFHRRLNAEPLAEFLDNLKSQDWQRPTSPYETGAPRPIVEVLERSHIAAVFEREVDTPSDCRTPDWYVRESAVHRCEHELQTTTTQLVDHLSSWYAETFETLTKRGEHESAGAVLGRGLEGMWKLQHHLAEWQVMGSQLEVSPYLVDFNRVEWNWEELSKKVADSRVALLRRAAASIPAHLLATANDDIPDYLGQAVHRVGEACFEALVDEDVALFADLFEPYFYGVFAIVERIRPRVADWEIGSAVSAVAEPIIDLLDLSGYAYVFAELYENPKLFEPCARAWHEYVAGEGGATWLKGIAGLHKYNSNLFAITHRATGRTRWQMQLSQILGQLPRQSAPSFYREGRVEHESPVIRGLAPSDGMMGIMVKLSDVFIARYLGKFENAASLDFGVRENLLPDLDDESDD